MKTMKKKKESTRDGNMKLYKFCLLKAYFDKGYQILSYVKFIIAVVGIASLNVKLVIILGLIFGILCFAVGWGWYKFGFVLAEAEVGNRFNLFVREMREKLR